MAGKRPVSSAHYARVIETRWSEILERPVVLSPREWTLIERWHAEGIPLDLVEEVMDGVTERRRRGSKPRSLARLAPAIEEAWKVVQEGRLAAESETGETSTVPDDVPGWLGRDGAAEHPGPLGELLIALRSRARAVEAVATLEDELDRALPNVAPRELVSESRAAAEAELESYRTRMTEERFRATVERAVLARLRRALDLPRG
jgi:hypothetical protein